MDYSFIKNLKRNERRVSKSFLKYRGAIDLFTEFLISYFSYFGPHWIYTSEQNLDKYVNHPTKIKGRKTILINYGNVDWNWKHYKIRGKSIGVCVFRKCRTYFFNFKILWYFFTKNLVCRIYW